MATRQDIGFDAYVVGAGFVGGHAAFALGDGTVRVFGPDGETIAKAHDGAVLAADFAVDRVITGGDDGHVASVAADGSVTQLSERPRKWIDHVAVGPDGSIAFASGRQAWVRGKAGDERAFDHERAVGGLAFAPKGFRLAVARYDGVSLWWAGRDVAPATLEWKGAHIGVVFSPDGRHIVTSMQENALHGWRLADAQDMRMSGYPAKPRSLSWSWKGRYLASSGANAAILWPFFHKQGPMGHQPLQLGPREPLVTQVACHPRSEAVAIGYQDGAIVMTGFEDDTQHAFRDAGDGPVTALAWDPRGERLAFGTEGGSGGLVTVVS